LTYFLNSNIFSIYLERIKPRVGSSVWQVNKLARTDQSTRGRSSAALQRKRAMLPVKESSFGRFLAHSSMQSALYASDRPSVCLSVTRVNQSTTDEAMIMQNSEHSSSISLVIFTFLR